MYCSRLLLNCWVVFGWNCMVVGEFLVEEKESRLYCVV
jgi:hypothetical protein